MKKWYLSVITAIILTICPILLSCGEDSSGLPPAQKDSDQPLPNTTVIWNPDGVIVDNEYLGEMQYGNYEIRWASDDKNAYISIKAKTSGWVAVGFNPTSRMENADMIIGSVQDGNVTVIDQFSTGIYGPHSPDIELGGTDDIIEFGGREEGGFTIIEFSRPLDTGDQYDNVLARGKVEIIWSYGANDDIERQHITRGYGEISL